MVFTMSWTCRKAQTKDTLANKSNAVLGPAIYSETRICASFRRSFSNPINQRMSPEMDARGLMSVCRCRELLEACMLSQAGCRKP